MRDLKYCLNEACSKKHCLCHQRQRHWTYPSKKDGETVRPESVLFEGNTPCNKSIEDKMIECKEIITRDPKDGDGDLITRTQSFIRQKAAHDKSKFKEAAIEIALLQKSPASQVWFMGCGQHLIEELEV